MTNPILHIAFSDDKLYRYSFQCVWGAGEKSIMFVGLNPSMSEGLNPTLTRCINFAKQWGYDSCYILNLFAYRAKTPALLRQTSAPIGEDNDKWLLETAQKVDKIIFAWGTHGDFLNRDAEVIALLPEAFCLETTKNGFPKHPLYVKSNIQPSIFSKL